MKNARSKLLIFLFITIFLSSTLIALGTSSPKNLYSGVLKDGENSHLKLLAVPFISQKKLYCSEASATMILHYYGQNKITQEYVHENISINFEKMLPPLT